MLQFWVKCCAGHLLVAVLLALSVALVPTPTSANDRPHDTIVTAHYPPFAIGPQMEREGYAVDILRIAAKRAGRDVSVRFLPFNRVLLALENRNDTIMPALFRMPQREHMFQWVASYETRDLNIMSVGSPVNTIKDARRLGSVALERESFADQFVREMALGNLVYQTTLESSARMLNAGRVDAWVQSSINATSIWGQLELDTPLFISPPIQSIPIYVTAGLGFPVEATQAYSNAIETMIEDGTIADIIASYR